MKWVNFRENMWAFPQQDKCNYLQYLGVLKCTGISERVLVNSLVGKQIKCFFLTTELGSTVTVHVVFYGDTKK